MQKIAILGFGLNGLIVSIAVKQAGYEVEIYEGGDLLDYKKDARTSVLTFETLTFFKQFGILPEIMANSAPINHIYVFEEKSPSVLGFDKSDENPFGVVIHNFKLKEILIKKIKELEIKIINQKVENILSSEGFATILDEKYKLIFDCTGKKKDAKTKIDISYNQVAFVFNISHTLPHNNIAVESFNPQGPLAILPMQNSLHSAVIWTVKQQSADFLSGLKESDFLSFFQSFTNRMGHVGKVEKIISEVKSYPLSLTFDSNAFHGRVLKIGDALNSIHPVAGQAFNMSIKDVKNFYNKFAEAKKLGLDIGGEVFIKSILKSNILHHAEMNAFTHVLVRGFSNNNNLLRRGRTLTLEALEGLSFVKRLLIKKASGKE